MLTLRAYFNLLLRNMIPQSTPELDEPKGVGPATLLQKSAKTNMHVTFNAKGNHNNQQHFGKEEGKGWHDKDLNLEFMGMFNLKKRSEVKIDC